MAKGEKLEWVLIFLAMASLWPRILGYRELWYQLSLLGVLAVMVWVARRRLARVRQGTPRESR